MDTFFPRGEPTENDEGMEVYEAIGTGGRDIQEDTSTVARGVNDSTALRFPVEEDAPHDPAEVYVQTQLRCRTEKTASCSHSDYFSDSQSSAGLSSSIQWCLCRDECAKYNLPNRAEAFNGELKSFWESVPREPQECAHVKNWFHFETAISTRFTKFPVFTMEALKIMFHVTDKGDPKQLSVELDDFLLMAKCFGTFCNSSGGSPMFDSFQETLTNSSIVKSKTSKISWFAGKMGREEAEKRLENQKQGTFLVRMSETKFGMFVLTIVAVRGASPVHFDLEFQEEDIEAADGACLATTGGRYIEYEGERFYSLHAAMNGYFMVNCFDDDHPDLICVYECPDLPFNRIVTGYKNLKVLEH